MQNCLRTQFIIVTFAPANQNDCGTRIPTDIFLSLRNLDCSLHPCDMSLVSLFHQNQSHDIWK